MAVLLFPRTRGKRSTAILRFCFWWCSLLHGGRQAARSGRSCGQDGQRDGRQTSGVDRNDLDLRRTGGQHVTLTERGVNGDRDRVRIHTWLPPEVDARICKRHPFDVI